MSPISRRAFLVALGATLARVSWAQPSADAFDGFPGTRVRFAPVETGRAILMADDDYVAAASAFQRSAILQSASPVSLDAFRRWNGDAVIAWPADQRDRWRAALESLASSFAALRIPLPPEVLLVATNGREMAGAPYTRANAIILPLGTKFPGFTDSRLLAHELWHLAARHAPALATRLYAEIGFEPMPKLAFPQEWAAVRIANPDAPESLHGMRLPIEGRPVMVAPVLVASRTTLAPGETFFNVLQVRLLEVEPTEDGLASCAVMRKGEPAWHIVHGTHDYLPRLGGNTGYVIHPEETIADNIALLATGTPPRNPELLARIKSALESMG